MRFDVGYVIHQATVDASESYNGDNMCATEMTKSLWSREHQV